MNEETWYVRHDNQVLGPWTAAELTRRLQARELTWLSLAIRPGDREWRLLDQVPGLAPSLGLDQELHAFQEAWIFLRIDQRRQRRLWFGPWTQQASEARLKSGELRFDDLAWREGMKNWVRLGDLEEFGAAPKVVAPPIAPAPRVPEVPGEELWRSIVHADDLKRLRLAPPPEAQGEDLVGSPEWMKILMAAFTGVLLLATGNFALAAGKEAGGGHLQIMPLKLTSESPALVLETDAGVDQPIEVCITGNSGEILRLASYRRTLHLRRKVGEIPTVNLSELELPQGRYHIDASVGETRASSTIFLGVEDAAFKQALAQHVKEIAAEQQIEKQTLFYTSRDLATLATKLATQMAKPAETAKWKEFYRAWRQNLAGSRAKLDRLMKDVRGHEQAFPERLEELKKAADQLRGVAADMDATLVRSRDPASVKAATKSAGSPSALAAELRKMTREAATLSASVGVKVSDGEGQPKNQAD